MLCSQRAYAALVVNSSSNLEGTIIDEDFTQCVVTTHGDLTCTIIASVMRKNLAHVTMTNLVIEVITLVIKNCYRYLSALDDFRNAVDFIDISKCLNDTMTRFQRQEKKYNSLEEDTVKEALNILGNSQAQVINLQVLLGPLLNQSNSGSSALV